MGSCGCCLLYSSEDSVDGVDWEREVFKEGLPGVFVVAASHAEEKGGGGVHCPPLLAEGVGKVAVLHLLAGENVGEAGVAAEANFDDAEGGDGADVGGPIRVGPVEEGVVVVHDEDIGAKFLAFFVGKFREHPSGDSVPSELGQGSATFSCIDEEVGVGYGGVRRFGEFLGNHVGGFVMSFNAKGGDLWV